MYWEGGIHISFIVLKENSNKEWPPSHDVLYGYSRNDPPVLIIQCAFTGHYFRRILAQTIRLVDSLVQRSSTANG